MKITRLNAAELIDRFLDGTGSPYEWDDFICSGKMGDPLIEAVRKECGTIPERFPPDKVGAYCNEDGMSALHALAEKLRRDED